MASHLTCIILIHLISKLSYTTGVNYNPQNSYQSSNHGASVIKGQWEGGPRFKRNTPTRQMTQKEMLDAAKQLIADATNSDHVSTNVEKKGDENKETAPKNSTNSTTDYKHLHKDRNGKDENREDFIQHKDDREDICGMCLCTRDLTRVSCEHINNEHKDPSLTLQKSLIPKETKSIRIRGYDQVTVGSKTFAWERTNLRVISFEGIGQLHLQKDSLNIAEDAEANVELTLKFENCNIPNFPTDAITQKMEGEHGRHSRVNTKAKRFLSIIIHRCHIYTIQERAMTRARLLYLNISNTKIEKIEHHAMDLEVYELSLFKGNTFPPLHAGALCLHARNVIFTGNYFEEIGTHSIIIETDSEVLFEFNKVKLLREEALKEIHPIKKHGGNIVFHSNTVFKAEPRSLVINPMFPIEKRKVLNNSFRIQCNCTIESYFHSILGTDPEEHDLGDSFVILLRRTLCMRPYTGEFITVNSFLEVDCAPFPMVIVVSVSIAFLLFIIAMTICIVCSLRMQHLRDEAKSLGECTSLSFSNLNRQWPQVELEVPPPCNSNTMSPIWIQAGGTAFPFTLAIPQVKTYQQNEVNEFTEWTESIRESTTSSIDLLSRKDLKIINRASCPLN